MIKQLITDFFYQIERQAFKKTKNSKATYWANELQEVDFNHKNYIGKRKAERYYEKYIEGKENVSVKIPNEYQRDFMAKYIGFKNFEHYKKEKFHHKTFLHELKIKQAQEADTIPIIPVDENVLNNNRLKRKVIIVIVVFITVLTISTKYKSILFPYDSCVVWKTDHYEKSSCFTVNAIDNRVYHIDISVFKKVTIDTVTTFFINEKPNIWYGKNNHGELEYFSNQGIHPETKKKLKAITKKILVSQGLLNK